MVIDKTGNLKWRLSQENRGMHIAYDINLNTRGITGRGKFFTVNVISIWTERKEKEAPLEIVVRVVGHPHGKPNGGKIDHNIENVAQEFTFKTEERAIEFSDKKTRLRVRLGDKQITQIKKAIDQTIEITKSFNEKVA